MRRILKSIALMVFFASVQIYSGEEQSVRSIASQKINCNKFLGILVRVAKAPFDNNYKLNEATGLMESPIFGQLITKITKINEVELGKIFAKLNKNKLYKKIKKLEKPTEDYFSQLKKELGSHKVEEKKKALEVIEKNISQFESLQKIVLADGNKLITLRKKLSKRGLSKEQKKLLETEIKALDEKLANQIFSLKKSFAAMQTIVYQNRAIKFIPNFILKRANNKYKFDLTYFGDFEFFELKVKKSRSYKKAIKQINKIEALYNGPNHGLFRSIGNFVTEIFPYLIERSLLIPTNTLLAAISKINKSEKVAIKFTQNTRRALLAAEIGLPLLGLGSVYLKYRETKAINKLYDSLSDSKISYLLKLIETNPLYVDIYDYNSIHHNQVETILMANDREALLANLDKIISSVEFKDLVEENNQNAFKLIEDAFDLHMNYRALRKANLLSHEDLITDYLKLFLDQNIYNMYSQLDFQDQELVLDSDLSFLYKLINNQESQFKDYVDDLLSIQLYQDFIEIAKIDFDNHEQLMNLWGKLYFYRFHTNHYLDHEIILSDIESAFIGDLYNELDLAIHYDQRFPALQKIYLDNYFLDTNESRYKMFSLRIDYLNELRNFEEFSKQKLSGVKEILKVNDKSIIKNTYLNLIDLNYQLTQEHSYFTIKLLRSIDSEQNLNQFYSKLVTNECVLEQMQVVDQLSFTDEDKYLKRYLAWSFLQSVVINDLNLSNECKKTEFTKLLNSVLEKYESISNKQEVIGEREPDQSWLNFIHWIKLFIMNFFKNLQ